MVDTEYATCQRIINPAQQQKLQSQDNNKKDMSSVQKKMTPGGNIYGKITTDTIGAKSRERSISEYPNPISLVGNITGISTTDHATAIGIGGSRGVPNWKQCPQIRVGSKNALDNTTLHAIKDMKKK